MNKAASLNALARSHWDELSTKYTEMQRLGMCLDVQKKKKQTKKQIKQAKITLQEMAVFNSVYGLLVAKMVL